MSLHLELKIGKPFIYPDDNYFQKDGKVAKK